MNILIIVLIAIVFVLFCAAQVVGILKEEKTAGTSSTPRGTRDAQWAHAKDSAVADARTKKSRRSEVKALERIWRLDSKESESERQQ